VQDSALEAPELGQVMSRQAGEVPCARGGESKPHDALIIGVAYSIDVSGVDGPIDQSHRAVVPDQQRLGHIPNCRAHRRAMPPDRQQELMLRRREPLRFGLLLAPPQEPTQRGTEMEEPAVVAIGQAIRRAIRRAVRRAIERACWHEITSYYDLFVRRHHLRSNLLDGIFLGVQPRLLGLVVLVGVACGLVGAIYLYVLHLLQNVLWPTHWSGPVGFAVLGGVGVFAALVTRFVGTSGDMELMVDNIHISGTATGVRMLRSLLPISWLCIASGGAMGPEAPLVQTTGTLASWTAQRSGLAMSERRVLTIAGMAAGFTVLFGAPLGSAIFALEMLHRRGLQYYEALLPAVLGALAGYGVYIVATGAGLAPIWQLPAPARLHTQDLGWAVVAGIGGALVAATFTYLTAVLRMGARRLRAELRPICGGLVLAGLALASVYPLTFGEAQTGQILSKHGGTVAFFALAAGAKLLGTSVTLSAEWRGGFIIPLFFIGACLGRAFHGLVPGTNEAVMMAALMAAANAGVTKTPIGSTLVVSEMSGFRLLPTTLVATMVSFILTSEVGLIHSQRERAVLGEQPD
jgi:H+/Cl- antiporter ClcA